VGFSTSQHFPRVFRKHTGLSPARYRLQEWAQKTQTEKS
jgi:AraC-like DNA-binding protein